MTTVYLYLILLVGYIVQFLHSTIFSIMTILCGASKLCVKAANYLHTKAHKIAE